MKKQNFNPILLGGLLLASAFLSSCSNTDLEKENIDYGTRTITFEVGQGFDESVDEEARSLSEKSDTIYQTFSDGTEIKTVIERDKEINSRIVYTVNEGTKVLAFIIDAASNKIYSIQELTVASGSKITCEVPNFDVQIIFYSNNNTVTPTTKLAVDDHISVTGKNNIEYYPANDAMWFKTSTIKPTDSTLGTIRFKHLFSRIRAVVHCDDGILSFQTTLENVACGQGEINVMKGDMQCIYTGNFLSIPMNASFTSSAQAQMSPYSLFIPADDRIPSRFILNNLNGESFSDKYVNVAYDYYSGYSYTFHMYVNIKRKIIWGWTPEYYQWDAIAPYSPDGGVPAVGSPSYFNNSSNYATNTCANAPTYDELIIILNSGVYWDNSGPTWRDYKGNMHKTGVWVKKKKNWVSASPGYTYVTVQQATNSQRNSDEYMFLPAAGFIGKMPNESRGMDYMNTSGNKDNYIETYASGDPYLQQVGEGGYYWLNRKAISGGYWSTDQACMLYFNSSSASIEGYRNYCYYGVSLWHFEE